MTVADYGKNVFINCPFDSDYRPLFEAIVFTVFDCGFRARCALEIADGGQNRLDKVFTLISNCKLGITDLSKTELDLESSLPRFNMPFELGVFLGAQRYGSGEQKEKVCLILDRERYRYRIFLSDIAGQEVETHHGDPRSAVIAVRNWLRSALPQHIGFPGGEAVWERYAAFLDQRPVMCRKLRLPENGIIFLDYLWLVTEWLKSPSWPD